MLLNFKKIKIQNQRKQEVYKSGSLGPPTYE